MQRRWQLPTVFAAALVATAAAIQLDGHVRPLLRLALQIGLFLALVLAASAIAGPQSPLRTGLPWRATVAVTPTRVLVVRHAFWLNRPQAIVTSLDRSRLPATLERSAIRLVTLRLLLDDGRVVRLRVPTLGAIVQKVSAPLVVGPAGTRWSVDERDPSLARLWSAGTWTGKTEPLFNVQYAQVTLQQAT